MIVEANRIAKNDDKFTRYLAWISVIFVVVIDFIAWKSVYGSFGNFTIITVFPLLGLLAWTLMWTHYLMSAIDVIKGKDLSSKYYWMITRIGVLILILLHPFLLAWNQFRVNDSLPPTSFYSYVASSLKVFVLFGSVSLIIFLSFEVFNHLKSKKWVNKNYKWLEVLQVLAMILIWFHAFKLGSMFSIGWFKFYWLLLGFSIIPCFYLVLKRAFIVRASKE